MRVLWILVAVVLPGLAQADGELFAVRDQNPLIRGAYLPLPGTNARGGSDWSLAAGIQWTNTVNIEQTPREQLLVDEESLELDLTLEHSRGPWQFRATLPVINRGPGILDRPIENWHRFFGLPNGDRPYRWRNAYAIDYARAGSSGVDAPRGTALGDLALEGGRVLLEGDDRRVGLWGGLEAPTGNRARLDGNGALDAALWLEAGTALGTAFSLEGRAGVSHPGGGTPLPVARGVGFGTLALSWHATPRLDASLQFDAHGAVARGSELKFLDRAVFVTFGGRYRLASGSVVEVGVAEDIEVDHSPDVTFHVGMRWPVGVARH